MLQTRIPEAILILLLHIFIKVFFFLLDVQFIIDKRILNFRLLPFQLLERRVKVDIKNSACFRCIKLCCFKVYSCWICMHPRELYHCLFFVCFCFVLSSNCFRFIEHFKVFKKIGEIAVFFGIINSNQHYSIAQQFWASRRYF